MVQANPYYVDIAEVVAYNAGNVMLSCATLFRRFFMKAFTIRGVEPEVAEKLKMTAAEQGKS